MSSPPRIYNILYAYPLEHCSNSAITINLWSIGNRRTPFENNGPILDAT